MREIRRGVAAPLAHTASGGSQPENGQFETILRHLGIKNPGGAVYKLKHFKKSMNCYWICER